MPLHDYPFDAEMVRLAILLGVVVSMLFYDRYHVTAGGAIVPGYLALFVPRPSHIVVTLLSAIATYWIVQRHLRPRYMLWGRRLFETEVLVALLLQSVWIGFLLWSTPWMPQSVILYGIGFVLPGIMAHDMGRQGVRTTVAAALLNGFIVFGLITLIEAFRELLRSPSFLPSEVYPVRPGGYAYPPEWLLIGVLISVLMSMALYHRMPFRLPLLRQRWRSQSLRAGGFVSAGYLALVANRPADLLFVAVCGGITYAVVTHFLMRQAILFGRTKMAAMFLTGMVITWLGEIGIVLSGLDYVPWAGFNAIAPTIVALVANDAQRQGVPQTLIGVGVSTFGVLLIVSLLQFVYRALLAPLV